LLVQLTSQQLNHISQKPDLVAYWIVDEDSEVQSSALPVLLKVNTKEGIQKLNDRSNIKGLALSGSAEIRPGFKSYDELADILEALEE
jgi:hypothetical protein